MSTALPKKTTGWGALVVALGVMGVGSVSREGHAAETDPAAGAGAEAASPPPAGAGPEAATPAAVGSGVPATPAPATAAVAPASATAVAASDSAAPSETVKATATPPAASPALQVGIGLRAGMRLQNDTAPGQLDEASLDTVYVEPRFSGRLNPYVGWQANFAVRNANDYTLSDRGTVDSVHLLDLIAKLDLHDLAHVWIGRMLVPSDRSNFSGVWFMSPWNYPGVYSGAFVGPRTGPLGRDTGAVLWGEVLGGKAKYYLGTFGLNQTTSDPMFAGRINVALLGAEPGYYHSSTYYGSKDVLAIGFGVRSQKNGSKVFSATDPTLVTGQGDLLEINADLLAEKNLGDAGVVTAEAAYYRFDELQPRKQAYFLLASYLVPRQLGIGRLQPLIRWQQAYGQSSAEPKWSLLDTFVTYVMDSYNARVALGYQRQDFGTGVQGNALQFGVQIQR